MEDNQSPKHHQVTGLKQLRGISIGDTVDVKVAGCEEGSRRVFLGISTVRQFGVLSQSTDTDELGLSSFRADWYDESQMSFVDGRLHITPYGIDDQTLAIYKREISPNYERMAGLMQAAGLLE